MSRRTDVPGGRPARACRAVLAVALMFVGAASTAQAQNRWVQGPNAQVLAVHAAMLKNGRVLFWGGSQNDPEAFSQGCIQNSRMYDPSTGGISTIASPMATDLFCSGHSQLPDGGIAIV